MGLGYSKVIGIFSVMTVVFYTISLPLFTRLWGIEGTAWAMLGATIPGIALVIYETTKIIHLRISHYARNVFGFHIVPVAASLFFATLVPNFGLYSTIWMSIFSVLLLALYFGLMVVLKWIPLASLVERLKIDT